MFIFIDRDHPAHKELGMTDLDFDEDYTQEEDIVARVKAMPDYAIRHMLGNIPDEDIAVLKQKAIEDAEEEMRLRATYRYRKDDMAFPSQKKLDQRKTWEIHRDNEGYLHHDTEAAVRCKDAVYYHMKHGYLHRADGPAAKIGYIDQPRYWYFFNGKELGMAEEGWIELWRITKNKDLFRCLDWTAPHGDRIHRLENLLSLITQEDLKDEDLFNYIWPLVNKHFVPPVDEETPVGVAIPYY